MKTFILILIYLSTAVGANLTLAAVGPWAMPIIALLFIGIGGLLVSILVVKIASYVNHNPIQGTENRGPQCFV